MGLGSRPAQVALVARVAPGASIRSVMPGHQGSRNGSVQERSVLIAYTVNSGYRLVVRGLPGYRGAAEAGVRISVQAASGQFEELGPKMAVTVSSELHGVGEQEREVLIRVESDTGGHGALFTAAGLRHHRQSRDLSSRIVPFQPAGSRPPSGSCSH